MNLQNASAIGWETNASGQRFGIGQSTGGLYFFRTNSAFGTTGSPGSGDMIITDTGDVNFTNKVTTNSLRVNSGGFSFLTIAGSYNQAICRDIIFGTLGQCASSLRYKSNVMLVIGVCAMMGLLVKMLMK